MQNTLAYLASWAYGVEILYQSLRSILNRVSILKGLSPSAVEWNEWDGDTFREHFQNVCIVLDSQIRAPSLGDKLDKCYSAPTVCQHLFCSSEARCAGCTVPEAAMLLVFWWVVNTNQDHSTVTVWRAEGAWEEHPETQTWKEAGNCRGGLELGERVGERLWLMWRGGEFMPKPEKIKNSCLSDKWNECFRKIFEFSVSS